MSDLYLEWAEKAVVHAGGMAQAIRRGGITRQTKSHQDFVTEADQQIEAAIRQELAAAFPQDRFFGEETAGDSPEVSPADSTRAVWILDPVDGTSNYASGLDAWCISLARVERGRVMTAALYAPDRNELYLASKGGGATLNGNTLSVSAAVAREQALVMTGRGAKLSVDRYLQVIRLLLERGYEYRRYGSGALGIAMVSTGAIQGYIETGMYPWDIAAAHLIVQEAGGYCSPYPLEALSGEPGPPLVVCQPGLETDLMDILVRADR